MWEGELRPRLASQSGQLVTVVGGAVLIGESDSSDEEDGKEGIPKGDPLRDHGVREDGVG